MKLVRKKMSENKIVSTFLVLFAIRFFLGFLQTVQQHSTQVIPANTERKSIVSTQGVELPTSEIKSDSVAEKNRPYDLDARVKNYAEQTFNNYAEATTAYVEINNFVITNEGLSQPKKTFMAEQLLKLRNKKIESLPKPQKVTYKIVPSENPNEPPIFVGQFSDQEK